MHLRGRLFILAVLVLWFSILATILYPGNAQVSFDGSKPMIIEQGQFMMFWALVLLLHFIAQTIWTGAQRREHDALVGRRSIDRRLETEAQAQDNQEYQRESQTPSGRPRQTA